MESRSFGKRIDTHCDQFKIEKDLPNEKTADGTLNSIQDEALFSSNALLAQISSGYKIMIIMRGPPGCGKTYLSRSIIKTCFSENISENDYKNFIFSSDDFFLDDNGIYNYNQLLLEEVHRQNLQRVTETAVSGWSPIIVDNTNIKIWEMLPYVRTAIQNGYILKLVEPRTPWCKSASKLAVKNKHQVSKRKIQLLLEKFEKVEVSELIKMIEDAEYTVSLPQYRNFPLLLGSEHFSAYSHLNAKPKYVNADGNTLSWDSYNTNFPKEQRKYLSNAAVNSCDCVEKTSCFCKLQKPAKDSGKNGDMFTSLTYEKESQNKSKGVNSVDIVPNTISSTNLIIPHKIGCYNENKSYISLRKMFPNKRASALWKMFVKYDGNIGLIVDTILLNKPELQYNLFLNSNKKGSNNDLYCECDNFSFNLRLKESFGTDQISTSIEKIGKARTMESDNIFQESETIQLKTEIPNTKISNDICCCHLFKNNDDKSKLAACTHKDCQIHSCKNYDSDILEINLGENLIKQLQLHFQDDLDSCNDFANKFNLNVVIPKYLAKELYSSWIESVCYQIELQRKDRYGKDAGPDYSLEYFEKPSEDIRQLTALKNNVHTEIVYINQNNLKSNMEKECEGTLLPQLIESKKKLTYPTEFKYFPIRSQHKTRQQDSEEFLSPEDKKRLALTEFENMRNHAAHHSQLKAECYQKAKNALSKGRNPVLLYFSQIADFHKSKIDANNHRAANCIVEMHNSLPRQSEIIDLHYLHVVEALGWLDIFIDKHIASLRATPKAFKHLFIITGRGLHSASGVSAIKTNVKGRLRDRSLRWTELNPGLLKIKIFSNSKYTKCIS